MLIVRKLLSGKDPSRLVNKRRVKFLWGCLFGTIFFGLYVKFIEEIVKFSNGSIVTLALCVLALTGTDAYAGFIVLPATPPQVVMRGPQFEILFWGVFVGMMTESLTKHGYYRAAFTLVTVRSMQATLSANKNYRKLRRDCVRSTYLTTDSIREMRGKMESTFGSLGCAVGGFLQLFLPKKELCYCYVLGLIVLYVTRPDK